MTLFNYGIQNEQSDLRAHVSVCNSTVYVFPTKNGMRAIEENKITGRPAFTGKEISAYGYPCPIRYIRELTSIKVPQYLFMDANFMQSDTTSQKGNKAVEIVKEMIKLHLIKIPLRAEEITEKRMQIKGTDIFVTANCHIQVKCDWRAGDTGNLYLQTAERNIFKQF